MAEVSNPQPADATAFRLLLVAGDLEPLRVLAEKAGHETVTVRTANAGLEFLDTLDHVDVVVASFEGGDEAPFDLLQRIKADPKHAGVKILLVCTNPSPQAKAMDPTSRRTVELLGCDKYLFMPVFDAWWMMREVEELLPSRPAHVTRSGGAY